MTMTGLGVTMTEPGMTMTQPGVATTGPGMTTQPGAVASVGDADAAAEGPQRRLRLVGAARRAQPAAAPVAPALSDREVEVLRAWFRCDSKAQAAAELYISVGTLNTHLSRVRAKYTKVGRAASTKAALVVRALQDGLISLDEW